MYVVSTRKKYPLFILWSLILLGPNSKNTHTYTKPCNTDLKIPTYIFFFSVLSVCGSPECPTAFGVNLVWGPAWLPTNEYDITRLGSLSNRPTFSILFTGLHHLSMGFSSIFMNTFLPQTFFRWNVTPWKATICEMRAIRATLNSKVKKLCMT